MDEKKLISYEYSLFSAKNKAKIKKIYGLETKRDSLFVDNIFKNYSLKDFRKKMLENKINYKKRFDFKAEIKNAVAKRANYLCSRCGKLTQYPLEKDKIKVANLSIIAHIFPAINTGPRGHEWVEPDISPKFLETIDNAIFLCVNCSCLIDANQGEEFTAVDLFAMKKNHEEKVRNMTIPKNDQDDFLKISKYSDSTTLTDTIPEKIKKKIKTDISKDLILSFFFKIISQRENKKENLCNYINSFILYAFLSNWKNNASEKPSYECTQKSIVLFIQNYLKDSCPLEEICIEEIIENCIDNLINEQLITTKSPKKNTKTSQKSNNLILSVDQFLSYFKNNKIQFIDWDRLIIWESCPYALISRLLREHELDNYNQLMYPNFSSKFFRGFESLKVGLVWDQDIPDCVIRIDDVMDEICNKFDDGKNLCLIGDSGSSKTTQAKIFLKEKKKSHHIMIIERGSKIFKTISEKSKILERSLIPWIILIDDLHTYSADDITSLNALIKNVLHKKIQLIATSRLSISTLLQENRFKQSRYFLLLFGDNEINFSLKKFQDAVKRAEITLIQKYNRIKLKEKKFNLEQLKNLYEIFHGNFVFLGYALLYGGPNSSGIIRTVHKWIKGKIESFFKSLGWTDDTDNDVKEPYISTFLAVCYSSLFDKSVRKKDFHSKSVKIGSIFEKLMEIGLIQKNIKNKSYRISHARLAQLIIQATKDGVFDLKYQSFQFRLKSIKISKYELLSEEIWNQFFSNSSFLINLNLGANLLTSLPESIGKLTSLTKLNLWNNKLTSLCKTIGNLTSLTELILAGNYLTSLPESVGKLTSLTELNLGGNYLTSLLEGIGKLTSLTEFNLWSNQLTSLPESIGKLTSLTEFNLWSNQLTSLPESIGKINSLKKVNFQ